MKEYQKDDIKVVWNQTLCKHAAECVKGSPNVFKPKEQPWITPDNSTTEKIIETVNKCPSGALTYYLNKND